MENDNLSYYLTSLLCIFSTVYFVKSMLYVLHKLNTAHKQESTKKINK